jgi:hypothetical protein
MLDHAGEGVLALEPRLLLHASHPASLTSSHVAADADHSAKSHTPKRLTPTQEVNLQYATFLNNFNAELVIYAEALTAQSTGFVPVTATVTATYIVNSSAEIQVSNAAVFGPPGPFSYSPPLTVSASFGTETFPSFEVLGSSGNNLIVNPNKPPTTNLPVGTVLTANVPTSAASSAMAIFPSYITNSTILLATNLVRYFNNIRIELPPKNTPLRSQEQGGAIQSYVYQNIAGSMATSLQQLLLAITLPATPGPDLQIYQDAAESAIAESNQRILDGIMQIWGRTLLINAQPPVNSLGETFNTGTATPASGSTTGTTATNGYGSTAT